MKLIKVESLRGFVGYRVRLVCCILFKLKVIVGVKEELILIIKIIKVRVSLEIVRVPTLQVPRSPIPPMQRRSSDRQAIPKHCLLQKCDIFKLLLLAPQHALFVLVLVIFSPVVPLLFACSYLFYIFKYFPIGGQKVLIGILMEMQYFIVEVICIWCCHMKWKVFISLLLLFKLVLELLVPPRQLELHHIILLSSMNPWCLAEIAN